MYAFAKASVALNNLVLPFLKFPEPKLFSGRESGTQLTDEIIRSGFQRVLLVSDPFLLSAGLCEPYIQRLTQAGIRVDTFSEVEPDPSFELVERGIALLKSSGAQAMLAIGGGSTMDTAKAMGLSAANNKHPSRLSGIWMYALPRKRGLPLYVVPTTAGTGSEATIVSVLSNKREHSKVTILDPKLLPNAVALEPTITFGLPPAMTAATGMDALTHAIEAYISTSNFKEINAMALEAAGMIGQSLLPAYRDGRDYDARLAMLQASNIAGRAFTRAGVGYVHAIAHQLGALYHLPHGLANAIVLPHVLEYSKSECQPQLQDLAERVGLPRDADAFIAWVRDMNAQMGIPATVTALRTEDFEHIIDYAFAEAHGTYGVPRYMTHDDARALLTTLAGPATA